MDEIWKLADVALVVPVVPPGAPPELEYALRLRRDTIIGGACPSCGAVLNVEALEVDGQLIPTGAALFRHRPTCPANDRDAKRQLQAFLSAQTASSIETLYDAANKQTRELVEPWTRHASKITSEDGVALTFQILDRLMPRNDGKLCPHLQEAPMQTWSCTIAEGVWRCEQCLAYHQQELLAHGSQLGTLEEHTCDLCRRYAPSSLVPLVLRVNHCVMYGGACSRCMERHSEQFEEAVQHDEDRGQRS
ncbi:hypothetical protein [Mumia sp. DW29H23]|uniref:hypothetical protein n=1 Tax=Mumia sp. DW29H23 TaxID=3421241 RepID=UPI003D680727